MYTCIQEAMAFVAALKGTPEQIADCLRSEIEQGILPPGAGLNQASLAARFGLSRIPIREALRQLSAEGYVLYRPNKGATVISPLSEVDFDEILEIRECLERRIIGHAVNRYTPALIRDVRAMLESMNAVAEAGGDVVGRHLEFHTLLGKPADRPRMTQIVNDWRFRVDEERTRQFILASRKLHGELLLACSEKDKPTAERCVAEEYQLLRSIAKT